MTNDDAREFFSFFPFQIIRAYPLKESDQKADSFFADLAVDVEPDNCNDAYAYLSDLGAYGLVVYSLADNNSWRFHHNFFHFDPINGMIAQILYYTVFCAYITIVKGFYVRDWRLREYRCPLFGMYKFFGAEIKSI